MHFRIITFLGDPARLDDGIAYTRTQAQPEVDAMTGSHGLSMWVERESGRSAVTTGWADRAALEVFTLCLLLGFRGEVLGFQVPPCYASVAAAEADVLRATRLSDGCSETATLAPTVSSSGDPCGTIVICVMFATP